MCRASASRLHDLRRTLGAGDRRAPFDVAPKLLAAKSRIDPATVLDMTVSSDTIGGSSGSPAINAAGEMIGANFDSTVLTQRNAYGYDRDVNRSIIVTSAAVTTALRDVYGMQGWWRNWRSMTRSKPPGCATAASRDLPMIRGHDGMLRLAANPPVAGISAEAASRREAEALIIAVTIASVHLKSQKPVGITAHV